jgi:hypothetical protein
MEQDALEVAAEQNWKAMWDEVDRVTKATGGPEVSAIAWENVTEECRQAWRDAVHRPHRGDEVERWLKTRRDAEKDVWGETDAYGPYDRLLDEYRLRADTGLLLHEDISLATPDGV